MQKISLYGASGHALVIMDIINANGDGIAAIFDDAQKPPLNGFDILSPKDCKVEGPLIISIGNNRIRKMIAERYPVNYATAIHPSAIISPSARIGEGSVVMQGAIIQTHSSIGKHCIINTGASIDHECKIGDFVHISPHATLCGDVHIGEGSWVGAGAVIIQGLRIGKNCMIGAGSVVINDIPDDTLVVGNPARPLRVKN